jgi:hypothetical protein
MQREETVDGVPYYVVTSGTQREIYWRKADLAYYMDKVQGAVEERNVPPRLDYVWPLRLGKRWEQTYTVEIPSDRTALDIARVCQVEGAETISVPAGSFQTIKIMCDNQKTGVRMLEAWYAPAVKQWIRIRFPVIHHVQTRELLSFKVQ